MVSSVSESAIADCERAGSALLPRLSSSPQLDMRTFVVGVSPFITSTFAIRCNVAWPATKCPKTVCLPFRCSQGSSVMKNLV